MAKLFLTLFLIIILFRLSFAYAEPRCADLFQDQIVLTQSLQDRLNMLLLNDTVVDRVDNARKQYFKNLGNEHYAVEYAEAFEPAMKLIYKNDISELERAALSVGMNKVLDDLSEIAPEFLPTRQLLQENIAVIITNSKRHSSKHLNTKAVSNDRKENVIQLDPNRLKLNSDYIAARKSVFKLIDSYAQNSMPRDLKVIRIEDLLLADVRYQLLKAFEKEALVERIVDLLEEGKSLGTEYSIEKYFSGEKARLP